MAVGDEVIGATVNTSGRLVVEATAVGSDTELSRIATLVEAAQTSRSKTQDLADKVSSIFVPTVLIISALTMIVWAVLGQGSRRLSPLGWRFSSLRAPVPWAWRPHGPACWHGSRCQVGYRY